MVSELSRRRIFEIDLLRGFFICVIILDHLQFWPSPLQYLTGQGRLWVSAAEGFFLISGLLIGYLRAYRGAHVALGVLSKKLLSRAAMLYLWCVAITLAVVSLTILLPGDGSMLPKLPDAMQTTSMVTYLYNVITMNYASDWIYFLRLYAIMLAVTPLFLWLIRRKKWWVALLISVSLYAASLVFGLEEAALQWQVLFFGAALIGWKLEDILTWLRQHKTIRRVSIISLITVTLSTMALSYFMVHGWDYVEKPGASITREAYASVRSQVDPLFSNNPMVPLRVGLAYLWFAGLLALFHVGRTWLMRYAGWLLLPFGERSLSAYVLQALVLTFAVTLIPLSEDKIVNGAVGVAIILGIIGLLKIPAIAKLLPR